METVEHHGRTTAYRSVPGEGESTTVLYVHGSAGTHALWSQQYAPSGPASSAVALDLSGHGASEDVDTPPGEATLTSYVDDVVAVAEATDAAVLVGNSLGGAVALATVLRRAVPLDGLVLAGSGAKLPVVQTLRDDLAADFEAAVSFLHGEDMLFHDPPERAREHSIETMRAVGQGVTRRDFETCHRFDVRDRLGEVDVPTLALCGEHDRLTPPSYHETLAEEIPAGEFETIPGAAHLAMIEQPEAFDDAVASFVGSIEQSQAT
ncbi:alpha/beta fold hydrolase [Halomicrobium mukohataei]|uniref:Alpha/beta fold hydrolase n=1 Tax=Halomicrobium mukohataei TaxID=57705 RepID=A0A847UAF9_9EURY|nr:alpha/beta hydrolase [Halomicrobium mukohataei]NLV10385.1 alpha/beta fold hydrolase [Halomicrobium mukohataei]